MDREKIVLAVLSSYRNITSSAEKFGDDVNTIVNRIIAGQPSTFVDRMKVESDQLSDRYLKLKAFIGTEPFKKLPKVERDALEKQEHHMHEYLVILKARINRQQKAK